MIRLDGEIGETGTTAASLAAALATYAGEPAEMVINSPGGSAYEGAAMLAELEAYPGTVTTVVRGQALSAASLVLQGADVRVIHPAAVVMLHDPAAAAIGPAPLHRAVADILDGIGLIYARAYAARSGLTVERVAEMMRAETWMSAQEAIEAGFADALETPAERL